MRVMDGDYGDFDPRAWQVRCLGLPRGQGAGLRRGACVARAAPASAGATARRLRAAATTAPLPHLRAGDLEAAHGRRLAPEARQQRLQLHRLGAGARGALRARPAQRRLPACRGGRGAMHALPHCQCVPPPLLLLLCWLNAVARCAACRQPTCRRRQTRCISGALQVRCGGAGVRWGRRARAREGQARARARPCASATPAGVRGTARPRAAPARAAGELYARNPKWTLDNPLLYQLPQLGLTQEKVGARGAGAPEQPAGGPAGAGMQPSSLVMHSARAAATPAPAPCPAPPAGSRPQGFSQEAVSDEGLLALQWAIPTAARLMEARYVGMIGAQEQVGVGAAAVAGRARDGGHGSRVGRPKLRAGAREGTPRGRATGAPTCAAMQGYWYVPITNERWGSDYAQGAAIMKGAWILNQLEDAAYYFNVRCRHRRWHPLVAGDEGPPHGGPGGPGTCVRARAVRSPGPAPPPRTCTAVPVERRRAANGRQHVPHGLARAAALQPARLLGRPSN